MQINTYFIRPILYDKQRTNIIYNLSLVQRDTNLLTQLQNWKLFFQEDRNISSCLTTVTFKNQFKKKSNKPAICTSAINKSFWEIHASATDLNASCLSPYGYVSSNFTSTHLCLEIIWKKRGTSHYE